VAQPAKKTEARLEFQEERCKGCGLCVLACPRKLLVVSQRLNNQGYPVAELVQPDRCNGCAFCAQICPDIVIQVWK
jgi:2-oxoglutarate ferredoxin oxidoreductase subunit delta